MNFRPSEFQESESVLAGLRRALPGYTPGWRPADGSMAAALMRIYSLYEAELRRDLAKVPERDFLAFLDMLGLGALPAKPARAPLVFTLDENAPVNVTLPAYSQAAAQPSVTAVKGADGSSASQPVIFSTEKQISLYRGSIAALYSIDPGSDLYADHMASMQSGFTLFDEMKLTEHSLYLGHDHLFNFDGTDIIVILTFTLHAPAQRSMEVAWEYLSESGWLAFECRKEDDTTVGFTQDSGQTILRNQSGIKAKKESINGRESFWIRGRLTTPLLPEGTDGLRSIPVFNDIRARLRYGKDGLLPEAAFCDAASLDASKDFLPFGNQPKVSSTFYLASKEVFQRKGASAWIKVELSKPGIPVADSTNNFGILWEYYDGKSWQKLSSFLGDPSGITSAVCFAGPGNISFNCPSDWAESKVNGNNNFWLRARITQGDFGAPIRIKTPTPIPSDGIKPADLTIAQETLKPPTVKKLTIGYSYATEAQSAQYCLSCNDFAYQDNTEASRWPDQVFKPFLPIADIRPALHFGFDKPFPVGLMSMFFDISQLFCESSQGDVSKFVWEYTTTDGWSEIAVLDETAGFLRGGMIQFIGPPDAAPKDGMGGALFRIRARLKQDEEATASPINGLWLNAAWAVHRDSYEQERIGVCDGSPNQIMTAAHQPVLEGEALWIQEWSGRGEGWRMVLQNVKEANLRFVTDPATTDIIASWVLWEARPHLYSSNPGDRHYTIERTLGLVRFGDGTSGMVPPGGKGVYLTYSSGGGEQGNVDPGAISELRTAMPFVVNTTNPIAASGGANAENGPTVATRLSHRLRNLDRGVSVEDVEWLARGASAEVARVRCLPITNADGAARRGWISLFVASNGPQAQPVPSAQLMRQICDYVAQRVPATVASRVRVLGVQFTEVSVKTEIVPADPSQAADVEIRLRFAIDAFLHPIRGGFDGKGWDFGGCVYLSQIARVIETTVGVDFAVSIALAVGNVMAGDRVEAGPNTLICAGRHEIKIIIGAPK